jgi:hypothetical protein
MRDEFFAEACDQIFTRRLDQIGESIFYQDGNYLVITLQVAPGVRD